MTLRLRGRWALLTALFISEACFSQPSTQVCAGCHGDTGAGDGPAAAYMLPRPRNFTGAIYKIRSTASGQLPTDGDLMRAIDDVLRVLHELGVDAFIAYGTLLGAVRNGELIGHDSDADLGYVSRHEHPYDVMRESFRLQRELVDRGYPVTRYSGAAFKVDVVETDGSVRGLDVFGGFMLDGFPRTVAQADALDSLLTGLGRTLNGVLHLELSDAAVVERLCGRLVCRKCQLPFHARSNPFVTCPGGECAGEHLYQREDDKEETIRARLATYRAQTCPLLDYYRVHSLVSTVSADGPVDEVSAAMLSAARGLARPIGAA